MIKSKIKLSTSYVSPLTLPIFIKNDILPVFVIRCIKNSELIGKYDDTAIHFKELSPSNELFQEKRDGKIDFLEFAKRYTIELSNLDFEGEIKKLEHLLEFCSAKSIVLLGYGSDPGKCHRSILRDILNKSGLLENKVHELIL